MFFDSHKPGPPLAKFIDRFWLCSDAPAHQRERILPSGTIELVINLREDELRIYDPGSVDRRRRYSGAIVSGTYSKPFIIDTAQHALIMGVHFKPGGAFPFLGLPANELTDGHVDLEILWGRRARQLRERLCAAASPAERFGLMEQTLLANLLPPLEHHDAVPLALDAFGRADAIDRVGAVTRRTGLSQRRFISVFKAEVGLTPKLYCRVQRFQCARAMARHARSPDWAQVAVACGYFDQSHLIRDFREFCGLSPKAYERQFSDRTLLNHVPVIE